MKARLILLSALLSQSAFAEEVVVWGEAAAGADRSAAKRAAIEDALSRAVQQAAGTYVERRFSASQSEVRGELVSEVHDLVRSRSRGLVTAHQVLEEEVVDGRLRVKVKAQVHPSKLAAALSSVEGVKLSITVDRPQLRRQLERLLRARGAIITKGAEVGLEVQTQVRTTRVPEDAPLKALRGQTRVEVAATVRLRKKATPTVNLTVEMSSVGTTEARALHRAIEGRGRNLAVRLLEEAAPHLRRLSKRSGE